MTKDAASNLGVPKALVLLENPYCSLGMPKKFVSSLFQLHHPV